MFPSLTMAPLETLFNCSLPISSLQMRVCERTREEKEKDGEARQEAGKGSNTEMRGEAERMKEEGEAKVYINILHT